MWRLDKLAQKVSLDEIRSERRRLAEEHQLDEEYQRDALRRAGLELDEGRQPPETYLWDDSNFTCKDGCNEECLGCFLSCVCTLGLCYCKSMVSFHPPRHKLTN